MPTVTLTVDAGVAGTMTAQKTVSGPDLTRFVAAVRVAYNVDPSLTDIQALQQWAAFVFQQAVATTRGVEQASASAGVTQIALT